MTALLRDLRHAFRKLHRNPGMSATTILALALGIGLTTLMLSILWGAFWRGLPFEESDRLMHLERSRPSKGITSMGVTVHDFVAWRADQVSYEDLAAFRMATVNISGEERAERFSGAFITPAAFHLLRVAPVRGRVFLEEETRPGAGRVVLIGHHVWRDRYGGDEDIVGRTIRTNGEPATVVGVLPEGFRFPVLHDVWLPLTVDPVGLERGGGAPLDVFGRLKDGVTLEMAESDIAGIARRLALEHPQTNEGVTAVTKPYSAEYISDDNNTAALTLLGAALFVLLIACANVASLLLARAVQRLKELGIRTAMGAQRWRLVSLFLLEAFAQAAVGAALGLGIAWAGITWLNGTIANTGAPFWIDIRLDGMSLLFALAAVFVATLAAGGLPAWQVARADVSGILKDESRGASGFRIGRLSRALVVFEIALSCALLVGAGLTIRSVIGLNTLDFAYRTHDVFTTRLGLTEERYDDDQALRGFYDEAARRIAAVPGVRAAGLTTSIPGSWGGWYRFGVEGATYAEIRDHPVTHRISVTPGFFEALGVQAVAGRVLEERDRAGSLPVAVVNESFATSHLEGDPLNRRIRFGVGVDTPEDWRTVVGVVPDMHAGGVGDQSPQAVYIPLHQKPASFVSVVAWTRGPPAAVTGGVRIAMTALDRDVPLYDVGSLHERIHLMNWQYAVFGTLFGAIGLAALFLAAVGLYAVMSFSVGQRVREVGIRMALGAEPRDVLALVLRLGLTQVGLGLLLGLALAAGLATLLTNLLFRVQPRDPVTFGATVLVLLAAGSLALLIPARRATRVDPVEALRQE